MPYQAVLFDLDGTLLDTLEDIADATNLALASHGFPTHPTDAYRTMVGDGVAQLIRRATRNENKSTLQAITAAYRSNYARNWNHKTRPYAGIPEMLDALQARGLKLAVLSNKPQEFTEQCVRELLPRWKFGVIQGAVPSLPLKPDPTSALQVAARLGIPPSGFLYLGDTAVDMKTARGAGMFAVGALWGFRDKPELQGAGAQALIERPEDLGKLMS